jgi:hypothetical protein
MVVDFFQQYVIPFCNNYGLAIITVVVIALVVRQVYRLEQQRYFTEYLFFIRYSIVFGALLVLLPIVARCVIPRSLANLLVLEPLGAAIVGFVSALFAWSIVYVGRLIWLTVPARCRISYYQAGHRNYRTLDEVLEAQAASLQNRDLVIMPEKLALSSLAMLLPLWGTICWPPHGFTYKNLLAFAGGVAAAYASRWITAWIAGHVPRFARLATFLTAAVRRLRDFLSRIPLLGGMIRALSAALEAILQIYQFGGYERRTDALRMLHVRAAVYFVACLGAYIAIGFAAYPGYLSESWQLPTKFPSLAILWTLLMVLIWAFGMLGFLCDRGRIPVVAVLLTLILGIQLLRPGTNEYPVTPWPHAQQPRPTSTTFLENWWSKHDRSKPLVAVAASGGGIRASLWTTHVLRELLAADENFNQRVALVSCVSGGAVGSLYYLNEFVANGPPNGETMNQIVAAAESSSLAPAVWGIAYPDFARTLFVRDLVRIVTLGKVHLPDRGWALEQAWRQRLGTSDPTFGSWHPTVVGGECPLGIFNATLQETGERLLLAPVRIPMAHLGTLQRQCQDLETLLDDEDFSGDMSVVTAARLSASFPYISPQARPATDSAANIKAYHAADGGYFDNSGLLTAIEVLEDFLRQMKSEKPNEIPKTIVLVEIRASSRVTTQTEIYPHKSQLWTALFGPFETMYTVQSSSQVARNNSHITLIREIWDAKYGVTLKHFVFHLSDDLPLSWHLTKPEQDEIKSHWPGSPLPSMSAEKLAAISAAQQSNQADLTSLLAELE